MSVDCLVLKIEEFDNNTNVLDNTIFVLYDTQTYEYLIRGKRSDTRHLSPVPFSFGSPYANSVADFLLFVLDINNTFSYTLYNYDELPCEQSEITYDYLKDLDNDVNYELVGYDNRSLKRKNVMSLLNILKTVSNEY